MKILMLFALIPVFATGPSIQAGEKAKPELSAKDHKDLGKKIGKYFKAKETGRKEADTLRAVRKAIDKINKKRKDKDVLQAIADWEIILDMATTYKKAVTGTESIKKPKVGGRQIQYALWVPKNYNPKQAWPLIVGVPDAGETAKDHLTNQWNDPTLREQFIICIPFMPENTEKWTEIEGMAAVLVPFLSLTGDLHIDCDRFFLAGTGLGAKTAAAIGSQFPHRFAGLVLRGDAVGNPVAENFLNLPVFFTSPDGEEAAALIGKLESMEGTTIERGSDDLAAIATWGKDIRRNSYPQKITFRPPKPSSRSLYWLEIDRFELSQGPAEEDKPYIEATIDRDANKITVTCKGVYSYKLYFNDVMLDLGKAVTVETNGKAWTGTINRNLRWFLDSAYDRNDNRLVFTGTRVFDTPPLVDGGSKK